jgi:hypothetical protein
MKGGTEVWLYGSRARGTADSASDTDLLVVGGRRAVAYAYAKFAYPRISVSHYEWHEIEAMRSYGSLFLHHLALEGVRLDPEPSTTNSRLEDVLRDIPAFQRAGHDLMTFRRAAVEARQSLASGGWADLELQVMATVVRHAAILGCYCSDEPDYGRETPFATLGPHIGFTSDRLARLATRSTQFRYLPLGHDLWTACAAEGLGWLDEAEAFIDALQPLVDGYEGLLHSAA